MKPYRFEIVRWASGRFGWIFVRIDERGRRVLARSERSYGSKKRVRGAIAALGDAQGSIVDATKDYVPFPLPATSFMVVPTVPLIVDESPVEERDAAYHVSAERAGKNGDRKATAAKPATAKTRTARRSPAKKKTT